MLYASPDNSTTSCTVSTLPTPLPLSRPYSTTLLGENLSALSSSALGFSARGMAQVFLLAQFSLWVSQHALWHIYNTLSWCLSSLGLCHQYPKKQGHFINTEAEACYDMNINITDIYSAFFGST